MRFVLILLFQWGAMISFGQTEVAPMKEFQRYESSRVKAVADTPSTDSIFDRSALGDVKYIVDPRIDRLMELHSEHEHMRDGFRVQIFLGDRKTAEETKRSFLQKHPEMSAHMSWLAPNFRLRVGDMPTRLEAEHLLQQLKPEFPGSYIVPDQIGMARNVPED